MGRDETQGRRPGSAAWEPVAVGHSGSRKGYGEGEGKQREKKKGEKNRIKRHTRLAKKRGRTLVRSDRRQRFQARRLG